MTAGAGPVRPPAGRPRSRRGEGERLRDEILAAAERLLLRTADEDAVSMRAIAEEAGVAPPSIYLHFADKSELLFEVCERHFAALDAATSSAAAQGDGPLDALRLRGEAYFRFGLEHPEHYRILFLGKPTTTPPAWLSEKLAEAAALGHLVEDVQRCVDAGVLRPGVDPFLVAIGLWMAIHGAVSLMIAKPAFPWPDPEVVLDHVLDTQVFGLGLPPQPPTGAGR